MNEQNLIDRLRDAAQGLNREAQDEMFALVDVEQCQLCCQKKSGGNEPGDDIPDNP